MQLTVGKNSILNFSRQIPNRNVQSPSSVSTVMTHHSAQPKPVWKKAPPGLQRPSRIANPSGWPSITPRYLTHTLDPALKAAGARVTVTIRLLKKDLKLLLSLQWPLHNRIARLLWLQKLYNISQRMSTVDLMEIKVYLRKIRTTLH